MNRLTLLRSCLNPSGTQLHLHHEIIPILFSYKKEIHNKFRNVKGLHCLDHIAINLLNPANEIVIFSQTPSIEYNLIAQCLWESDITFYPDKFKTGEIIWWDQNISDASNEIKKIKETDHHFMVGFNLHKKVNDFKFVYSFATRNKDKNIRHYYKNITPELISLGDYCYKLINNIYRLYCSNYEVPKIISNYSLRHQCSHLRLISNNQNTP